MLNKAVEWEVIEANPIAKLKYLPEAKKRNVRLLLTDAEDLLNELPDSFSLVVEYAIYTGHRLNNILNLKIEDVSFHDIGNTGDVRLQIKGGKWESYPLSSNAVDVLRRSIGKRKGGYAYINPNTGTRYYSVSQSFRRAVKTLNLKVGNSYLRFHDLKHVSLLGYMKEECRLTR